MSSAPVRPRSSKLLDSLTVVAQQLNKGSDSLSNALNAIQSRLNESGIGIEAWVPILETRSWDPEVEDPFEKYFETQLGYGRLGDGWALLTRHVEFETREDGNTSSYSDCKLLARASRDIRLQAVKAVPQLLEAIERRATEMLDQIREAERLAYGTDALSIAAGEPNPSDYVVECQVSGRQLRFRSRSDYVGDSEFISLEVLAMPGLDEKQRKLCDLVLTRQEIERALGSVRPAKPTQLEGGVETHGD